MNHGGKIIPQMKQLAQLFAERVPDRQPLDELAELIGDRSRWHKAHALCAHVGHRMERATKMDDATRSAQCDFETACLKTLFNMTQSAAPFDPDSPYWIVPCALNFAHKVGIDESKIVRIVTPS